MMMLVALDFVIDGRQRNSVQSCAGRRTRWTAVTSQLDRNMHIHQRGRSSPGGLEDSLALALVDPLLVQERGKL